MLQPHALALLLYAGSHHIQSGAVSMLETAVNMLETAVSRLESAGTLDFFLNMTGTLQLERMKTRSPILVFGSPMPKYPFPVTKNLRRDVLRYTARSASRNLLEYKIFKY
jgi:hypothetical protein